MFTNHQVPLFDGDEQFWQILLSGYLPDIRRATLTSDQRLKFFSDVFTHNMIHRFCRKYDMILIENEASGCALHYKLSGKTLQENIDRLKRLGLWEAFLLDQDIYECMDTVSSVSVSVFESERNQDENYKSDILDCEICANSWNID